MCQACCSRSTGSSKVRASIEVWTGCLVSTSPNPPDRVQVWASQLAAGDFPPVCAMTGLPAETWRRFRFSTAPVWAIAFVFLLCVGIGFFVMLPLAYLVGRRASGRLPLTRRSKRLLELPMWGAIVVLAFTALVGIGAAVAFTRPYDPANPWPQLAGIVLLSTGFVSLLAGGVLLQMGLQLGGPLYGPRGKVMKQEPGQPDRLIELQR